MLTPKEQRAMARTIRVLRREANRERYAPDASAVLTAIRAGDAVDAVQSYVITAKVYRDDAAAKAVWEGDLGSPVEPEPAQLRPVD